MKKIILFAITTFAMAWTNPGIAQTTVSGKIDVTSLYSVQLVYNKSSPVKLQDFTDYSSGKITDSYCKIKIMANSGWRLMASVDDRFIKGKLKSGSIQLRVDGYSDFISISNEPVELLRYPNKQLENNYNLSLKVMPELGSLPDNINRLNVSFSLEPY